MFHFPTSSFIPTAIIYHFISKYNLFFLSQIHKQKKWQNSATRKSLRRLRFHRSLLPVNSRQLFCPQQVSIQLRCRFPGSIFNFNLGFQLSINFEVHSQSTQGSIMLIYSFSIVYLISKFVSLSIKENELIVIVDLVFASRLTE